MCEDEKEMYNRLFANADVKTANMCEGDCSCSYQIKEKMNVMGRFKVKRFSLEKRVI